MLVDKNAGGVVYTERPGLENAAATADASLALDVLGTLADPVVVLDREFRYRYVNAAAARLVGRSPTDLLGLGHEGFHPPEAVATLNEAYRQALATGRPSSFEAYCELVGRWFDVNVWPYGGDSVVVLFRDATERMALADQVASTGQRLCDAFSEAAVGVTVTSVCGAFYAANPAFCRMTGYSFEELRELGVMGITHPDDRELNWQLRGDLEAGRIRTMVLEKRYIRKDRTAIWVRANVCGYGLGDRPEWFLSITEDVTERRRTAERLLHSEARFRALTENATDLTAILDAEGRILYHSASIGVAAGYRAEEITGRVVWDFLHPDDAGRMRQLFSSLIASRFGATMRAEFRFRDKAGRWRTYEGVATNLLHNPAVSGILMNSRDITERTESQAALEAALAEARSATELKSRFLANMSHEIRTPMNGVLGTAELLSQTRLDEEQSEYVDVIRRAAASLLTILNDVLDMSKIEAGKLQLESTAVESRAVVRGVAGLFRTQAAAKGVAMTVSIDRATPRAIRGDPVRLTQVLTNLIGNAVKFTTRGHITVAVRAGKAGFLRFSVADTGVGIPSEHHGAIFSKFAQGDSSTTRRFGGTGLGLAISKQLVELMGGEIGFTSVAGHGSRFWFTLPAVECAAPRPRPAGRMAAAAPAGAGRVLLAEDNEVNRRIAYRILEKAGYSVAEATDGRAAVEAFRAGTYDVVLMDVHMPELDGLAATRALRQLERNVCRTPVIAITANAMNGDRERCLAAGMDDYLAKPYKAREILEKVQTWSKWRRERSNNPPPRSLPPAGAP